MKKMENDKQNKGKTGDEKPANNSANNIFFPQSTKNIQNNSLPKTNDSDKPKISKLETLGSKEFEEYKKTHIKPKSISFSQKLRSLFKKDKPDKIEKTTDVKNDTQNKEGKTPENNKSEDKKPQIQAKEKDAEKANPKNQETTQKSAEGKSDDGIKIGNANPNAPGSKEFEAYYQKHKYDSLTFLQKLKKFFSKSRTQKEEEEETKRKNREKIESLSLAKSLMAKNKKKKRQHLTQYDHIKRLKSFLEKSGTTIEDGFRYLKFLGVFSVVVTFFLTIYLLIMDYYRDESFFYITVQLIGLWIFFLFFLFLVLALLFFVVIDFKIYARKKEIENVLADYLQLTSANVSAGMPIDQALWLAIRPKFGILAKEMEDVAKATMSGEDLKVALTNFANKYDSFTVKRSVSILIEGMESGGKIGPLLDKISINIQDTALFKKEMAANVTTYVIFITFASIVAAPFLFALSYRLMLIITKIMSSVDIPQEAASSSMFSMGGGEAVISQSDFMKFIILALVVTALFSAIIISIIQKGNVKDGIKYIPIFIVVSLIVFFIANTFLGYFFAGIG